MGQPHRSLEGKSCGDCTRGRHAEALRDRQSQSDADFPGDSSRFGDFRDEQVEDPFVQPRISLSTIEGNFESELAGFSIGDDLNSISDAQSGPEAALLDWIRGRIAHREQQSDVASALASAEKRGHGESSSHLAKNPRPAHRTVTRSSSSSPNRPESS